MDLEAQKLLEKVLWLQDEMMALRASLEVARRHVRELTASGEELQRISGEWRDLYHKADAKRARAESALRKAKAETREVKGRIDQGLGGGTDIAAQRAVTCRLANYIEELRLLGNANRTNLLDKVKASVERSRPRRRRRK